MADNTERARLIEWANVHLSAKLGVPQFKNPGELKAAIRALAAELEARLSKECPNCGRVDSRAFCTGCGRVFGGTCGTK